MHDSESISAALRAAKELVVLLEEVQEITDSVEWLEDERGAKGRFRQSIMQECRRQSRILDAHLRPRRALIERADGVDSVYEPGALGQAEGLEP